MWFWTSFYLPSLFLPWSNGKKKTSTKSQEALMLLHTYKQKNKKNMWTPPKWVWGFGVCFYEKNCFILQNSLRYTVVEKRVTHKSPYSQELNVSYNSKLSMAIYLVLKDFLKLASEELWKVCNSLLFRETIILWQVAPFWCCSIHSNPPKMSWLVEKDGNEKCNSIFSMTFSQHYLTEPVQAQI